MDDWQKNLKNNFTNWERLADFLEISPENRKRIVQKSHFPLNIPLKLAEKVEKGNLSDPILRQFLPLTEELEVREGFTGDPVGESSCRRTGKLLQKYQARVLFVTTSACAMNCRFCFRRSYPYEKSRNLFSEELALIQKDPTITEVILSGGDPLSMTNQQIEELFLAFNQISHLERIRIHTRFPLGFPERINDRFLELIEGLNKQLVFVLHSNHPNELDKEVFDHLRMMQKRGVILLNQSVLLNGVNNDIDTLERFFLKLSNNGVIPYYLHQLDQVNGAWHFEVPEAEGRALIKELMDRLPGYAVPRYVKEIPGVGSKVPL